MTMGLILLPAMLIVVLSFYLTFMSAAKLKKGIILNTTLPNEARGDGRVKDIVRNYKRVIRLGSLLIIFLCSLIFLINYMSLLLGFFFFLIGLMLGLGEVSLRHYSGQLRALKMQEGWFVGKKDVVTVDLVVSREKDKMPVSKIWFLPPALITVVLFIWAYLRNTSYFPPFYQLTGLVFFIILWVIYARERTVAHSCNSEVNLAIARVSIYSWTKCWVQLAWIHSFWSILQFLFFKFVVQEFFMVFVLFEPLVFISMLVWTSRKIRLKQDQLLAQGDKILMVDDDHYWHWLYYNNPNDNRLLVEKRIGYGQMMNIGITKGKIIWYGTLIPIFVLVAVVLFAFVAMDFSEFSLDLTTDEVRVQAPFYGFIFGVDEIKSLSLTDSLPKGRRTNGAETSQYSLGNYMTNDYGKSKLYVYHDNPPYLVVELEELYVIFNSRDPKITKEYYFELVGTTL